MSGPGPASEAADGDYEYRDLIVEAWDVFRADGPSWPDVAFYRIVIQANAQPALDDGCATWRHANTHIFGCDSSNPSRPT